MPISNKGHKFPQKNDILPFLPPFSLKIKVILLFFLQQSDSWTDSHSRLLISYLLLCKVVLYKFQLVL